MWFFLNFCFFVVSPILCLRQNRRNKPDENDKEKEQKQDEEKTYKKLEKV